MFYGLTSKNQIVDVVLNVVGNMGGNHNVAALMLGTCAAETNLGQARDKFTQSGFGLFQLDKIAIDDIKARTRSKHRELIEEVWNIDIDRVDYHQLHNSPLLAAIFCRLFYLLIPEAVPSTIEGRAEYWKKYYNTAAGKGTPVHYMKQAEQLTKLDFYNVIIS